MTPKRKFDNSTPTSKAPSTSFMPEDPEDMGEGNNSQRWQMHQGFKMWEDKKAVSDGINGTATIGHCMWLSTRHRTTPD
jgi:hypothetical protein